MSPRPRAAFGLALCAALSSACDPAPAAGPTPNVALGPAATTPGEPRPDPRDPATHLARLRDPALRPAAARDLAKLLAEALEQDGGDRKGPHAGPLVDGIAEPLNALLRDARFAESARKDGAWSALVGLAAETRHPATIPCLVDVLAGYRPDENEQDIQQAVTSLRILRAAEARPALLSVFVRMRPSRPAASRVYRPVYDAMLALADPAWEGTLIELLRKPLGQPVTREARLDDVQWHTLTAAQILGDLRSEKAVTPLLEVMLTPQKADAHMTSILALLKIGKPAAAAAVALLEGKSTKLVEYARAQTYDEVPPADAKAWRDQAHQATAALVLGTIGREEGRAAVVAAMATAAPVPRAIMARELPKLPRSPDAIQAFQKTLEKTSVALTLPPAGQLAAEALAEEAPTFFDADLVPWLARTAAAAKGNPGQVASFREAALIAAMKLARAKHLPDLDRLAKLPSIGVDGRPAPVGKAVEREMALVKAHLAACKDDLDCHLAAALDPANATAERQFVAIKAACMTGVLGSAAVKPRILAGLPAVRNAAVRALLATVIDRLSPDGDVESAGKLQRIIDDAERSKDGALLATQSHFRYTAYRLSARAQP